MEIENTQENKETSPMNVPNNNQELETDGSSSKKAIIGLFILLIPYIIFIIILLNDYISGVEVETVITPIGKIVITPIFVWIQYIIPILVWIPCSIIYYLFFRKEQKGKNILIGTILNITRILCFISALIVRPDPLLFFLGIFIILEIILFSILTDKKNSKKVMIGLWISRIPYIFFILNSSILLLYILTTNRASGGDFIPIIIVSILVWIPCKIIYYLFFRK